MNNLVIMHDKQAVTSSLQVAETFGKRHDNVIQTIVGLLKNKETHPMFAEGTYTNEQNGQQYPMYYMNRDGFSLLAMGFTGKKAMQFKLQYIEAFNSMEATLKKVPAKKLDPVLQAELAISRTKTAKANALYRIAMATGSDSTREQLLAKAAESITGERIIPVMKKAEYTAEQVAKKLNISSSNMVGRICNSLGLKAEQPGQNEYGRWSADKSKYSAKETPNWLYFDKGVEAIKDEAIRTGKLDKEASK